MTNSNSSSNNVHPSIAPEKVTTLANLIHLCNIFNISVCDIFFIHNGFAITFENWDGDAVLHKYSMGNKHNMWETMGFPWDSNDVSAHTTEELIRLLIKYKYHSEKFE